MNNNNNNPNKITKDSESKADMSMSILDKLKSSDTLVNNTTNLNGELRFRIIFYFFCSIFLYFNISPIPSCLLIYINHKINKYYYFFPVSTSGIESSKGPSLILDFDSGKTK